MLSLKPDQVPRCQLVRDEIGHEALVYLLPDLVRGVDDKQELRLYGAEVNDLNAETVLRSPLLISVNEEHFFMPALWRGSKPETYSVLVWVKIALPTALRRMRRLGVISGGGTGEPRSYGIIANLVRTERSAYALFGMAELAVTDSHGHPELLTVPDPAAPFGLLDSVFGEAGDISLQRFLYTQERLYADDLIAGFECAVDAGAFDAAEAQLRRYEPLWKQDARAQFAAGRMFAERGAEHAASNYFHRAQQLGHPRALKEQWACERRLTLPFRKQHPEIFAKIRNGDRLRALTELRAQVAHYPDSAPAILSYCLRNAGVPDEGLAMCDMALARNRKQSDVLANRWQYLLDLKRETEGLETALEHARGFPQEPIAARNTADSLLLCGRLDEAKYQAERYAVLSTNLGLAAKQLFSVYEQLGEWAELLERFDEIIEFMPRPSAATLTLFGEVLIENGDFNRCSDVFERALILEPGNGKVILGYARALARSDKEVEAECLLQTALADRNRVDRFDDRLFLMTLLAEIQRRTGRPEEALRSLSELERADALEVARKAGPLPGIELAEAYLALGRVDDARTVICTLSAEFPEDPFVAEMVTIAA